uniref:Uncharacterized protein n=1 Tax=Octactis speculum TaxID=3111310 RepID=A0A7S2BBV5_9STRA
MTTRPVRIPAAIVLVPYHMYGKFRIRASEDRRYPDTEVGPDREDTPAIWGGGSNLLLTQIATLEAPNPIPNEVIWCDVDISLWCLLSARAPNVFSVMSYDP